MDDFETLMRKLQQQAIEDASRLDPAFAEQVEEDRRAIEEHERKLEEQRLANQKETPKTEWHNLWEKIINPRLW